MGSTLGLSPRHNQTFCARAQRDVNSDTTPPMFVCNGEQVLTSEPCFSPALPFWQPAPLPAAEVQPGPDPLCPQWEKELSRQSCQTQFSLSNRAGRQGSLFFFSHTRLPNQGHPAGLVRFPEMPTENLVLMAGGYVSASCFILLLSNSVVPEC